MREREFETIATLAECES